MLSCNFALESLWPKKALKSRFYYLFHFLSSKLSFPKNYGDHSILVVRNRQYAECKSSSIQGFCNNLQATSFARNRAEDCVVENYNSSCKPGCEKYSKQYYIFPHNIYCGKNISLRIWTSSPVICHFGVNIIILLRPHIHPLNMWETVFPSLLNHHCPNSERNNEIWKKYTQLVHLNIRSANLTNMLEAFRSMSEKIHYFSCFPTKIF